jgi:trk/ktr system potassium uptake protein
MNRYAVLGLGVFGARVAVQLEKLGAEVVAVDRDPAIIESIKSEVSAAVVMDSTDEDALKQQEIDQVDVAVVSMGENFESNVLTTMLLKKLGVERVVARASEGIQSQILRRVGADDVLHPEEEIAERLAHKLYSRNIIDFVQISKHFHAGELDAPRAFIGKTLDQIELRRKFGILLIDISRMQPEEEISTVPGADTVIREGDRLIVAGKQEDIEHLAAL